MSTSTKIIESKVHGISDELKTKVKLVVSDIIQKIKEKHL